MSRIAGNLFVTGTLQAGTVVLSSSCVTDEKVSATADISASKLEHNNRAMFAQASGTNATAETRTIYTAVNVGSVTGFKIGAIVAATGDSTATLDLKKNGTTILTGTVQLTSATAAYTLVAGTVGSSAALAAGDVLTVVMTVSAGTGTLPQGVFAYADILEDGQ